MNRMFIYLLCTMLVACQNQKHTSPAEPILNDEAIKEESVSTTSVYPRAYLEMCRDAENRNQCTDKELLTYLFKNMEFSNLKEEDLSEGDMIVTQFIIQKNGAIDSIRIQRGERLVAKSNFIKLIENMPEWEAPILDGDTLQSLFTFPLKMHFDEMKY